MKLLKDYQNLRNQIFEYFGYKEDWVVIPLEDSTGYFWTLYAEEGDYVHFAETKDELQDEDTGDYYETQIDDTVHLPKSIYRGKDYTMIVVNTCTGGEKFLQILSNAKEIKSTDQED